MPFMYRRKHHVPATTVVAPPRRRGLFGRRRAPVRVQQRRPTLKDKVVGAFTRLTGGLTHRSGVKVRYSDINKQIQQF